MGGWVGWIFLFAGAYLTAVVVRGMIQLVGWLFEDPLGSRRKRRWLEESGAQHHEPQGAGQPHSAVHGKESQGPVRYPNRLALALAILSPAHWLAEMAEGLKVLFFRGSYDFWVGRALRETDPRKKVADLSKALALNPNYEPAWGLKANTLLKMERYAEALECFEKVLELQQSATTWYKKGLCCYHLKRREAALECFGRAIASCQEGAPDWLKDAAKKKDLLEEELRHQGISQD
jgi:tetratricopeptide (TPR) repeat protein